MKTFRKAVGVANWICLAIAVTPLAFAAEAPAPHQDDAALHDVQWLGSTLAFAVGDHGTLWRSTDGGAAWEFIPTPTRASLRSVTFLTDQMGWIAGSEIIPYVNLEVGVVYSTVDGGATWERRGDRRLPGVTTLRFFTPDDGLAVCQPAPQTPSGVFRTSDGGVSWTPLAGAAGAHWTAAFVANPDTGICVSETGQVALIGDEQVRPSRSPTVGSRTVRGMCLSGHDGGWIVGDGGLVLTTSTGGVTWQNPSGQLPLELRSICDFLAVEQRGAQVWILGAPGSVIWHSPDNGRTWQPQRTTETVPLRRVRFVNERLGLAVGELGVVLRTDNGGTTWQSVRGAGRRLAALAVTSRPGRVPVEVIAKYSGDLGYRMAAWIPTRTPSESDALPVDGALAAAVIHTHGANGATDWRLPVDLPGLERDGDRLIARWQQRTEGRAPSVFVGSIVKQLRMWRPDVVLVDEAPDGDVLAAYMQQALMAGVREAADGARHLDQVEFLGLRPWKAARVFQQLSLGSRGPVNIDLQEQLPHSQMTVQLAAAAPRALLSSAIPEQVSYRPLDNGGDDASAFNDFFQGLKAAPGSETRRLLVEVNHDQLARDQQRVEKQGRFLALAAKKGSDPVFGPQLVAQLPDVLKQARADEGASLLATLAMSYRDRQQLESAEATYLDLIHRYPNDPAALASMRWLVQYWTSAEVSWQRVRKTGLTNAVVTNDVQAVRNRVEQASSSGFVAAPRTFQDIVNLRAEGTVDRGIANRRPKPAGAPPDAAQAWRERAIELAQQLEEQAPALFERPEIQFPLAALRRTRGSANQSDAVYRKLFMGSSNEAMKAITERELWLGQPLGEVPRSIAICRSTKVRPHLDGVLSDPCWQRAVELNLGDVETVTDDNASRTLVLLAYDQDFLYLAASCPRYPGATKVLPERSDRRHDADLDAHDRLALSIDVDRDYATWYEFQIDQRGETRDRCWQDQGWNPQWYVAVDGDDERWRIEAAIPWSELVSAAPFPKQAMAMSLTRILPGQAVHGWTPKTTYPPRWESFGLVRFE